MLQSKKKVSERSVIGSGSQMLVDTQKVVAPGEFGFLNHFKLFQVDLARVRTFFTVHPFNQLSKQCQDV